MIIVLLNHQMNYTCTYCNVRRGIWTMKAVTKTRTGLELDWSILANSYRLMQARAYSDVI